MCLLCVCSMAGCGGVDCSVKGLAPSKLQEEAGDTCATTPECAICLQACVHPVRLPCCHVFCYLCVKGASWHSRRCALCRQEVPEDFLERPVLLSVEELKAAAAGVTQSGGSWAGSHGDNAWYYEGRDGWWQYDERTSRELEEAFSTGRKSTEMLIAGFLYVADLENLVQYRRNEHGRRRKMKRDAVDIPKKGVAGLRLEAATERARSADGSDTASPPRPSTFGILSVPPVRPPTLLGRHVLPSTDLSPSHSTLEESFSQLLVSQPEGGEVAGDSESEEESASGRGRAESVRESQPSRMPPRGVASHSGLSLRSRSPDGQCTVTEV